MTNTLLAGIRVLDLTRLLPGPFCTLYLAQMGAEVIKIEEPSGADGKGGDYLRYMFPEMFEQVNRGKRSVTLDLRTEGDVAALHALVRSADVLVESFRPGVMDKLGCGYEVLKAINPRLVYAAITGYGQNGPYRNIVGHDVNYLCHSGILDQIGSAGGAPVLPNVQIADLAGGALTAAIGILGAVIGVGRSGRGAFVDAAMFDGALALQVAGLASLNASGHCARRGEDTLSGARPNYQVYRCRDGGHVAVGAIESKFFSLLIATVREQVPAQVRQRLDVALDWRDPQGNAAVECNPLLKAALDEVFLCRDRDDWALLLGKTDACTSPVLNLAEALHHEQAVARGMVETASGTRAFALPIRFDNPLPPLGPSPALGADNAMVLETAQCE